MKDFIIKTLIATVIVFSFITAFYYFVSPYEKCLKKWHYDKAVGVAVQNDFVYCHNRTKW